MTTWSKSNISIEGTRVPHLEELYEGMEVLQLIAGEYDATHEMNFFPYILTSEDIDQFKAYDGNIMYGKGKPLEFIRINKTVSKIFDNKNLLPGMDWNPSGAFIILRGRQFYLKGGEELTYDQYGNLISITIKTNK